VDINVFLCRKIQKKGPGAFCRNGPKGAEHKRLLTPFSDPRTKKADVAERPETFDHVGLLVNEPSRKRGLLFA
jgi:hypothetical protein